MNSHIISIHLLLSYSQHNKSSEQITGIPRLLPNDFPNHMKKETSIQNKKKVLQTYSAIRSNTTTGIKIASVDSTYNHTTNDIIPATILVKEYIGLMWLCGIANTHPAASLLHYYNNSGCPDDTGGLWSKEHIIQAIKRAPHISARDPVST